MLEMMLERQRDGIAKAKAQGKCKGRKPTARARAQDAIRLFKESKSHLAKKEISGWLEKLGMTEYARRALPRMESLFRCSTILTDQDLEKIGVLLGHRRKILAAIASCAGGGQRRRTASAPKPITRSVRDRLNQFGRYLFR
jgi:hypothetical protein